jgi:hypothetical protein
MPQMDIGTYVTQIVWLLIVLGILYVGIIKEEGLLENISRVLKVRGKRKGDKGVKEEERKEEKILEIIRRVI